MIHDVTQPPLGAVLGLMGWPWPGDGGTLWRDGAIVQRVELTPDNLNEARWNVEEHLREYTPKLAPWAESMEWLQGLGRGDLVGVLDLRSGAVLLHTCIAWREDYRDEADCLWSWQWVIGAAHVADDTVLIPTHADASGALLDAKGRPTMKALVKPSIGPQESRVALEEWHRTAAPLLAGRPPVKTWPVEHQRLNEDAFAAECRRILDEP